MARELVVGLKMKDVFSNRRLFMSESARELFAAQDQRVFIDFFSYDKEKNKILVGQLELSLIELIQESLADEAELAVQARLKKARAERDRADAERKAVAEAVAKDGDKLTIDEKISDKARALE